MSIKPELIVVSVAGSGWDASLTHLHTWVEKGTVRVKYLAQEHNTMSPGRARPGSIDPESSVVAMLPLRTPKHPIHGGQEIILVPEKIRNN